MDDQLDYITEVFYRAVRAAWSWLGAGGTLLFWVIERIIFRGSDMNLVSILAEVGAALLLVVGILFFWELRAAYSYIKLKPFVNKDHKFDRHTACLVVESNEATKVACSAKLVQADFLFSMGNVLYKHPQKLDTLEWTSQNQEEEKICEVNVQPFDKTRMIAVAQLLNGIVFTYCHVPRSVVGHGVVLVRIRLDGVRADGRSIWPRYFTGYLYAFNVGDQGFVYSSLGFREGHDWKSNEEIPQWIRNQKVVSND
jgi:hypothetical protein